MRYGLENLRFSPASPRSGDSNSLSQRIHQEVITTDEPPLEIHISRSQLAITLTAFSPDGNQAGTAVSEFVVVNSQNARIVEIAGTTDEIGHTLHKSLFEFASRSNLNVLPSERMKEATKKWLTDTGLPDRSTPNI
jgi:hypothetical protein